MNDHTQDDIKALALKKPPEQDWPYPLILDQIKARQKAAKKMPDWLTFDNVVFPPADLIEQASSDICAHYKSSIVHGKNFVDLTGGSGMDSFALLSHFKEGISVEHNPQAAQILEHNAAIFNFGERLSVKTMQAEDFVQTMPPVDLIYIDPQRRDEGRKGKFDLSACTPDIYALLPILRQKCRQVLLKTSPVLDIQKTIADLKDVKEVHVVQYQGDCKELLFLLDLAQKTNPDQVRITAMALHETNQAINTFSYTPETEKKAHAALSLPLTYIYEPDPAFQKTGGYNTMAEKYNIYKLHPNTHLYTSDDSIPDFPGRTFQLEAQCAAQKKELKKILPGMKGNLTIRNFPSTTDLLRKKLALKDGGNVTIFACELLDGRKALLKCIKIQRN